MDYTKINNEIKKKMGWQIATIRKATSDERKQGHSFMIVFQDDATEAQIINVGVIVSSFKGVGELCYDAMFES